MYRLLLLAFCLFGSLQAANSNPVAFSFYVVPRQIASGDDLKLGAFLAPAYNVSNAEVLATLHKGKVYYHYSSALRKFMQALGVKKCAFKKLEQYLKKQLFCALKDPEKFLEILSIYTQTGIAPVFTVTLPLQ
ncbi:MAG: hypothetical protein JSR37_05935 [Verrucomicrobia bacterium]|nr:hypothetical protein [Verrucomicrobiota bacterium]MBS0636366.1 hypothetical protein [Verrucomicrobiota bacterium]